MLKYVSQDPIPKSPWKGIYDGTKIPLNCPFLSPLSHFQLYNDDGDTFSNEDSKLPSIEDFQISGKEDCLTLNVFTSQVKLSSCYNF